MIKFSRTGWNNVIIFSVMAFILLINLTQNKQVFKQDQQAEMALLGEHAVILSLTVNQQTNIERIGQTWRALPANIQAQPLEAMMKAWHEVIGLEVEEPVEVDRSKAVVVSLVLAGQSIDEHLMLIPLEQELIVFKQSSKQWFSFPKAIFAQLIPKEVMM